MIKVGEKITSENMYGKRSNLTGTVTHIQEKEGRYRGDDIITVKWSDGQVARFYAKDTWSMRPAL